MKWIRTPTISVRYANNIVVYNEDEAWKYSSEEIFFTVLLKWQNIIWMKSFAKRASRRRLLASNLCVNETIGKLAMLAVAVGSVRKFRSSMEQDGIRIWSTIPFVKNQMIGKSLSRLPRKGHKQNADSETRWKSRNDSLFKWQFF